MAHNKRKITALALPTLGPKLFDQEQTLTISTIGKSREDLTDETLIEDLLC